MLLDCCYLHADINEKDCPKIHLRFVRHIKNTGLDQLYTETLLLKKDPTSIGNYKICGIDDPELTPLLIDRKFDCQGSISSIDLLKVVLPFAIADAICDTSYHEPHLAENVIAFGAKGKKQVLEFSEKFLGPQKQIGKPAYRLSYPFIVDVEKQMVEFDFECLIEKYEGKGRDYVYLNDEMKVKEIGTVRESGKYSD